MEGHMCDYKCENFGGHHECTCPDGSIQVGDSCTHPQISKSYLYMAIVRPTLYLCDLKMLS